ASHVDVAGIGIIAILSYVGAAVSWFFPWHRLPVERFLVVIVMPGLVLLGFMLMATGGVRSHILPIFIAPAVFMAAAYGFRAGAAIEIGRASCRERGEMRVADVRMKTKDGTHVSTRR